MSKLHSLEYNSGRFTCMQWYHLGNHVLIICSNGSDYLFVGVKYELCNKLKLLCNENESFIPDITAHSTMVLYGYLDLLLCDDDLDDCCFFKEALEALPQSTILKVVHDGEQLMRLLAEETYKLPHVLFLDLNMPRKNGFECLVELKLNDNLERLPVIIFSTSLEQEVVNLLYRNGAHYFIRKPSEFSQIKTIIQYALTLINQENILQPTIENFVLKAPNSHEFQNP